ncbi:sodium/hydrogen exchanger [Desulfosarcina widdelii]|uniref:Sodium/hydrogen exchanger n=1 Tax=Desulfosarcina widdelii TaxID=947919 RepID=A0A5K7ZHG9_9BACT|nr:cation:proton antiporter [Desulfosarcina widdelii]BBO75527.1 sodium/hydrogen exchanger [Desulfosarcina widdelii]
MLPLLLTIGVLYIFAIGVGRLSAALGIPRVTGYLLVGLVAGPYTAEILGLPAIVTKAQLAKLSPLHDMILSLIVFTIGGSFRLKTIRKIGSGLFRLSAFEIGLSALLVWVGTLLMGASPLEAGFLSVMAITTAPAATQMVMREYQSRGSLTDTILPLIGINNLLSIIAFILLMHYGLSTSPPFWKTMIQLLGPLGLGVLAGTFVAVMDQRLTRQVERQMLVLGAVALATGAASYFHLSAMLSILVAGVVAVNAAPHGPRMLEELSGIDYPFYVLFFIMAGAELHIEALFHMGVIGLVYIVARSVGKFIGCRTGARMAGMNITIRNWLGPAMLAQAGLVIGLSNVLAKEWPGPGKNLQTLILASVVVFEMVGPLLTRTSLVNAGEITVLNLLGKRSPVGYGDGLRRVFGEFVRSLGLSPIVRRNLPGDIRVSHIMRHNVEVLSHRAPFDEVVKTLGHSSYDSIPVVNDSDELIGVVKFADVSDTLFDPGLRHIVVAADIATDVYLKVTPEDTLQTAILKLKNHPRATFLLVVAQGNPSMLVGIVSHNDLLAAQLHYPR